MSFAKQMSALISKQRGAAGEQPLDVEALAQRTALADADNADAARGLRNLDRAQERWVKSAQARNDGLQTEIRGGVSPGTFVGREDDFVRDRADARSRNYRYGPIDVAPFVDPLAPSNIADTGGGVAQGVHHVDEAANQAAISDEVSDLGQGANALFEDPLKALTMQLAMRGGGGGGQQPPAQRRGDGRAHDPAMIVLQAAANKFRDGSVDRGLRNARSSYDSWLAAHHDAHGNPLVAGGEDVWDFIRAPWRNYEEHAQARDRARFRGDTEGAQEASLQGLGDTANAVMTVDGPARGVLGAGRAALSAAPRLARSMGEVGIREAPSAAAQRAFRDAEAARAARTIPAQPVPDSAPPQPALQPGVRTPAQARPPIDAEFAPAATETRTLSAVDARGGQRSVNVLVNPDADEIRTLLESDKSRFPSVGLGVTPEGDVLAFPGGDVTHEMLENGGAEFTAAGRINNAGDIERELAALQGARNAPLPDAATIARTLDVTPETAHGLALRAQWRRAEAQRQAQVLQARPVEAPAPEAAAAEPMRRADGRSYLDRDGGVRMYAGMNPGALKEMRGLRDAGNGDLNISPGQGQNANIVRTEGGFVGDSYRDIINARRRVRGTPELTLQQWVRRRGGISDDRGDLEDLNQGLFGRGRIARGGKLARRNGARQIDDLAQMAWEDGYFTDVPTRTEFIDAVKANHAGRLAPGVTDEAVSLTAARDTLQHYEELGVDVNLPGRELTKALREMAPEGAAQPRTTSTPITLKIPDDPSKWRELVGQHPFIANPSRAIAIIMENARLPNGRPKFTTDQILDASGYATPNVLAVTLAQARKAGIPLRTRAGQVFDDVNSPVSRAIGAMERHLRNGAPTSWAKIERDAGIPVGSLKVSLSKLRNGRGLTTAPPELAERLRAAEQKLRELRGKAGAGVDPDDILGWLGALGYGAAVSTAVAEGMGPNDANAAEREDAPNYGEVRDPRAYRWDADKPMPPLTHDRVLGSFQDDDGSYVVTHDAGAGRIWAERVTRGPDGQAQRQYMGQRADFVQNFQPRAADVGAVDRAQGRGHSPLLAAGIGLGAALLGRGALRRGLSGVVRDEGRRALLADIGGVGAGAASGAIADTATGGDPATGAMFGGMGGVSGVAGMRGLRQLRAPPSRPWVRGPTSTPRSRAPAARPDPARVARGVEVQRLMGVQRDAEALEAAKAAAPPMPPPRRLVGGRDLEQRLQAPDGGRGGPETHLRALGANELRQAASILGVPVGRSARGVIPALARAIRDNPKAVELLRDAGLAGLVTGVVAAAAATQGTPSARAESSVAQAAQ